MQTLWQMEKLLVLSNFSFCYNVFRSRLLQMRINALIFGKWINYSISKNKAALFRKSRLIESMSNKETTTRDAWILEIKALLMTLKCLNPLNITPPNIQRGVVYNSDVRIVRPMALLPLCCHTCKVYKPRIWSRRFIFYFSRMFEVLALFSKVPYVILLARCDCSNRVFKCPLCDPFSPMWLF